MDEQKIPFYRLDGSLDSKMQDQCLTDFENSQTTHILMASLQTAGVGLNINCANIAFIMVGLNISNPPIISVVLRKLEHFNPGATLEPHS